MCICKDIALACFTSFITPFCFVFDNQALLTLRLILCKQNYAGIQRDVRIQAKRKFRVSRINSDVVAEPEVKQHPTDYG